jgi:hypothetical protein
MNVSTLKVGDRVWVWRPYREANDWFPATVVDSWSEEADVVKVLFDLPAPEGNQKVNPAWVEEWYVEVWSESKPERR